MDPLGYARLLTGMVLAVHILLAVPGVGLPLYITIAHFLGLWRQDPDWLAVSQRWTRLFAVLFPIGALTGTLLAPILALVWPPFMELLGQVGVLPMFIEGFAFFTEAIFLGIYLYGRDRISNPWWHWASSLPLVLAAAGSAFLITTVNAWMQTPAGFVLRHGQVVAASPWQAMFNRSTTVTTAHVLVTAYLTVAFLLAAWTAWPLRRRLSSSPGYALQRKALALTLSLGFVFALATVYTGDLSARLLAREQPAKLAAIEVLYESQPHAPLTIGGWPDPQGQRVIAGLSVPSLLSWLAFRDGAAVVRGLNEYPRSLWPPLIVHLTFDLMVGIGFLLLLVPVLYLIAVAGRPDRGSRQTGGKKVPSSEPSSLATPASSAVISDVSPPVWPLPAQLSRPWLVWLLILAGPLAFAAIELGWLTTELGRQPWIIYEVMTVAAALTQGTFVPALFWALLALYAVMALITLALLRRVLGRHSLAADWQQARQTLLAHNPVSSGAPADVPRWGAGPTQAN